MTYAISANGLALIQDYEGYRAEPAQLPDGNWIVGHGHVRIGEAGAPVSREEAASLLALDTAPVERLVNARVSRPLTQSQFDALVSFATSVGAEAFEQSQVLRRVNAGEFVAAACAMDAWRKSEIGGELAVVDSLVRRRAAEKALFLQDLPHEASPSAFLRAKLDHAASILGAPIAYTPAPAVGSIPVAQPKPEPVARITEILKSEALTEALLLTQVVTADDASFEDEIVTAHARPVARPLDGVREATRRAYVEQHAETPKKRFSLFKRNEEQPVALKAELNADRRIRDMRKNVVSARTQVQPAKEDLLSFESVGLLALVLFGLGLMAIGATVFFGGQGDVIDVIAASAVAGPGFLATVIGGLGLWRAPKAVSAA